MMFAFLKQPTPSWLLWLLFFSIPLNLFAYFNLEVSYKYEVDSAQTMVEISPPSATPKAQRFARIGQREQEIRWAQRRSLLYAALAAGATVALALRNHQLQAAPAYRT